jgi:hypothetical protein
MAAQPNNTGRHVSRKKVRLATLRDRPNGMERNDGESNGCGEYNIMASIPQIDS